MRHLFMLLILSILLLACAQGDPYHLDWSPHDAVLQVDGVMTNWTPPDVQVQGEGGETGYGCLELVAQEDLMLTVRLVDTIEGTPSFCVQTNPTTPVITSGMHSSTVDQDEWDITMSKGTVFNLCPAGAAKDLPCD